MTKPGKNTRDWVDLAVKGLLKSYVSWFQFGIILAIIAGAIGYLFVRGDNLMYLILKLHGSAS